MSLTRAESTIDVKKLKLEIIYQIGRYFLLSKRFATMLEGEPISTEILFDATLQAKIKSTMIVLYLVMHNVDDQGEGNKNKILECLDDIIIGNEKSNPSKLPSLLNSYLRKIRKIIASSVINNERVAFFHHPKNIATLEVAQPIMMLSRYYASRVFRLHKATNKFKQDNIFETIKTLLSAPDAQHSKYKVLETILEKDDKFEKNYAKTEKSTQHFQGNLYKILKPYRIIKNLLENELGAAHKDMDSRASTLTDIIMSYYRETMAAGHVASITLNQTPRVPETHSLQNPGDGLKLTIIRLIGRYFWLSNRFEHILQGGAISTEILADEEIRAKVKSAMSVLYVVMFNINEQGAGHRRKIIDAINAIVSQNDLHNPQNRSNYLLDKYLRTIRRIIVQSVKNNEAIIFFEPPDTVSSLEFAQPIIMLSRYHAARFRSNNTENNFKDFTLLRTIKTLLSLQNNNAVKYEVLVGILNQENIREGRNKESHTVHLQGNLARIVKPYTIIKDVFSIALFGKQTESNTLTSTLADIVMSYLRGNIDSLEVLHQSLNSESNFIKDADRKDVQRKLSLSLSAPRSPLFFSKPPTITAEINSALDVKQTPQQELKSQLITSAEKKMRDLLSELSAMVSSYRNNYLRTIGQPLEVFVFSMPANTNDAIQAIQRAATTSEAQAVRGGQITQPIIVRFYKILEKLNDLIEENPSQAERFISAYKEKQLESSAPRKTF